MIDKITCILPGSLAELFAREPIIAHYFNRSEVIETTEIPNNACAAIAIDFNRIKLLLNPNRFKYLFEEEKQAIIVHEYMHLFLGHLDRRVAADPADRFIMNLAQDIAINQIIKRHFKIPKFFALHNSKVKNFTLDLAPDKSTEYYFQELLQIKDKLNKIFVGTELETTDDHSQWGQSSKKVLANIAQTHTNFQLGSLLMGTEAGSHIAQIFDSGRNKIRWSSAVSSFIDSIKDEHTTSYRKISRRLGEGFPGTRRQVELDIMAIIDVSASMQPYIADILSELNALSVICEITICMCDTDIKAIIPKYHPTPLLKVVGLGGTDLQPAVKVAAQSNTENIIIFTDGRFKSKLDINNINTLWVVFGNPGFKPHRGDIIHA